MTTVRPVRAALDGRPGIAWPGPLADEITVIFDVPEENSSHAHVWRTDPDLVLGEEVYVAREAWPIWLRELE